MDLAATSLLIIISFCAIMIDVNDIYNDYGINEKNITIPTLILFCIQWGIVLSLIHVVSRIPLHEHFPIKEKMLYFFMFAIAISSIVIIVSRASDIRDALIMDLADVRNQHYEDLANGPNEGSNYLMLLPNILTSTPFPTLALFLWFYTKSFTNCNFLLRAGILVASIVQAVIAIVMAGRAAMVYWAFDFFMLYSYFYRYLSKGLRRNIRITAAVLGSLAAVLFISITLSRFDGNSYNRNPFDSLYGYAGQHVNNFCTMFEKAGDSPLSFDRIFPLMSKFGGHSFELFEHYDNITSHIASNIYVNVFDTFGAEIYLDLGWFGYIGALLLLLMATVLIRSKWTELSFEKTFFLVIVIAFFTRGIFAWPFVHHYTTLALLLTLSCCYLFKYKFRF